MQVQPVQAIHYLDFPAVIVANIYIYIYIYIYIGNH